MWRSIHCVTRDSAMLFLSTRASLTFSPVRKLSTDFPRRNRPRTNFLRVAETFYRLWPWGKNHLRTFPSNSAEALLTFGLADKSSNRLSFSRKHLLTFLLDGMRYWLLQRGRRFTNFYGRALTDLLCAAAFRCGLHSLTLAGATTARGTKSSIDFFGVQMPLLTFAIKMTYWLFVGAARIAVLMAVNPLCDKRLRKISFQTNLVSRCLRRRIAGRNQGTNFTNFSRWAECRSRYWLFDFGSCRSVGKYWLLCCWTYHGVAIVRRALVYTDLLTFCGELAGIEVTDFGFCGR